MPFRPPIFKIPVRVVGPATEEGDTIGSAGDNHSVIGYQGCTGGFTEKLFGQHIGLWCADVNEHPAYFTAEEPLAYRVWEKIVFQ